MCYSATESPLRGKSGVETVALSHCSIPFRGGAMFEVYFLDDKTAAVRTRDRSILVEQAHVILKKMRGRWVKVLVGVFRAVVANRERAWPVEVVLGALALGERIMMAAQTVIKAIIPEHFGFRLRVGDHLDAALVW